MLKKKAMKALIKYDERSNTIDLVSTQGIKRTLPANLYEKLAEISDPFSSKKDFVGYVDPKVGIVLVDASTLLGTYETQTHVQCHQPNKGSSKKIKASDEPVIPEETNERNATSLSPSISPKKTWKTMHQLAYEKKNKGMPVPSGKSRPISGFGVKNGKVYFNSTTFNAFTDDFHTDGRGMGSFEMKNLEKLFMRLREEETNSHVCEILKDCCLDL